MRQRVWRLLVAATLLGAALLPLGATAQEGEYTVWTYAMGLHHPRDLALDLEGRVLVTDQGTGNYDATVVRLEDLDGDRDADNGAERQVVAGRLPSTTFSFEDGAVEISSVSGIAVDADGEIWMAMGGFPYDPIASTHTGIWSTASDDPVPFSNAGPVTNLGEVELALNPDGDVLESNPYDIAIDDDGTLYVSDAAGNTIYTLDEDGTATPFAVLPMVAVPPQLGLPFPVTHPVPTGIAIGPDDALYIGQLTGFPFSEGAASVWRASDDNGDGDARDSGELEVYVDGLTTVTDVAFDNAGNLLVAEFRSGLSPFFPETPGRVLKMEDGEMEVIADGLVSPTGVIAGPDGTVYVTQEFLGVVTAIGTPSAPPPPSGVQVQVIAAGLEAPRGLTVTNDGTVYVAQAGNGGDDCVELSEDGDTFELCFGSSGKVTSIANGVITDVISGARSYGFTEEEFIGPQDVSIGPNGGIYATVGLGADPRERDALGEAVTGNLGDLVVADGNGGAITVVDVAALEVLNNPDGGLIDSNPFSLIAMEDGWVVSDAGANAVLLIDRAGNATTLAAFADTMVPAPPFLGLPPGTEIPMQHVPTGITQGPDGALYAGQLTGFPFVPGAAAVYRIVPGEDPEVYADGFTNIIDVAFDADGNLYVLEIVAGGLLNIDPADPGTLAGRLVRVAPDGTQTTVPVPGLVTPSGLAIDRDGALYISNYGLMPGMGQVLKVTLP